jgi:hypothetical protein
MPLPVMNFPDYSANIKYTVPWATALGQAIKTHQNISEAQQAEQKANLPFGGANVPGPAGQVVALEMVKRLYGENSPQFQRALNAYNLEQESTGSRINYQNVLAGTAPQRMLTPHGKSIEEEANVSGGLQPTGQAWSQAAPASASELAGGYQLLRQKGQTDAQARARNLNASNIDKTISMIDPDALTKYSGLKGTVQKGIEAAKTPLGKESGDYRNYKKSMQKAELLATQVRQFYGDSIQPVMIERLERLTNPSTWKSNPELAKAMYLELVKVLKAETGTYRQAMKSTKPYTGESEESASKNYDPLGLL